MSALACLAYQDNGTLGRAPASILDHQCGGIICRQHVLTDVTDPMPFAAGAEEDH